jgi:hypothetical protein
VIVCKPANPRETWAGRGLNYLRLGQRGQRSFEMGTPARHHIIPPRFFFGLPQTTCRLISCCASDLRKQKMQFLKIFCQEIDLPLSCPVCRRLLAKTGRQHKSELLQRSHALRKLALLHAEPKSGGGKLRHREQREIYLSRTLIMVVKMSHDFQNDTLSTNSGVPRGRGPAVSSA